LGQLLGRIDVEDLLDVMLPDFCIGKVKIVLLTLTKRFT